VTVTGSSRTRSATGLTRCAYLSVSPTFAHLTAGSEVKAYGVIMHAQIDADILKYACGFACQKTVYQDEDGEQFSIKKVKQGMQVTALSNGVTNVVPGVFQKKAVLEQLPGEYTELVVPEPDTYCRFTVKRMLEGILKASGATSYQVHLTRGKCFRFGVYPEYKHSRMDTPKPYHLPTVEDYLIKHWGAVVHHEIEADDAVAIEQCNAAKRGTPSIICTIDKDLDMVPGWRYSWSKGEVWYITEEEGLNSFWKQMLTGDSADDIPGVPRVGDVTAEKLLHGLSGKECKQKVLQVYKENGMEDVFERNAMLLWMLRKPLEQTYNKTYAEFMAGSEQ